MTAPTWSAVMVTGHRPQHLHPNVRPWVRDELARLAIKLRDEYGTTVGISDSESIKAILTGKAARDDRLHPSPVPDLPSPEAAKPPEAPDVPAVATPDVGRSSVTSAISNFREDLFHQAAFVCAERCADAISPGAGQIVGAAYITIKAVAALRSANDGDGFFVMIPGEVPSTDVAFSIGVRQMSDGGVRFRVDLMDHVYAEGAPESLPQRTPLRRQSGHAVGGLDRDRGVEGAIPPRLVPVDLQAGRLGGQVVAHPHQVDAGHQHPHHRAVRERQVPAVPAALVRVGNAVGFVREFQAALGRRVDEGSQVALRLLLGATLDRPRTWVDHPVTVRPKTSWRHESRFLSHPARALPGMKLTASVAFAPISTDQTVTWAAETAMGWAESPRVARPASNRLNVQCGRRGVREGLLGADG